MPFWTETSGTQFHPPKAGATSVTPPTNKTLTAVIVARNVKTAVIIGFHGGSEPV